MVVGLFILAGLGAAAIVWKVGHTNDQVLAETLADTVTAADLSVDDATRDRLADLSVRLDRWATAGAAAAAALATWTLGLLDGAVGMAGAAVGFCLSVGIGRSVGGAIGCLRNDHREDVDQVLVSGLAPRGLGNYLRRRELMGEAVVTATVIGGALALLLLPAAGTEAWYDYALFSSVFLGVTGTSVIGLQYWLLRRPATAGSPAHVIVNDVRIALGIRYLLVIFAASVYAAAVLPLAQASDGSWWYVAALVPAVAVALGLRHLFFADGVGPTLVPAAHRLAPGGATA